MDKKIFFAESGWGGGGGVGGRGGRTEDPARIREAHFARWVASRSTGFSSRWASPISSLSTSQPALEKQGVFYSQKLRV